MKYLFLFISIVLFCKCETDIEETGSHLVKYSVHSTGRSYNVQIRMPNENKLITIQALPGTGWDYQQSFDGVYDGKLCEVIVKANDSYNSGHVGLAIYIDGEVVVSKSYWEQEHESETFFINYKIPK